MKRKNKSETPSAEEWRSLYKAAIEFRDLKPWTWMSEMDLFGIQNPHDEEMGYCCVLGELGEVFALAVYLGSEGLAGYLRMQSGEVDADDPDVLHLQKCLMASFENREDLEQADLRTIKRLGFKFRGRGAWPQFRSFLPGYLPWYLTSGEAKFLTVALEQAVHIARRHQKDPNLLTSLGETTLLARVSVGEDEHGDWRDRWMALPELEEEATPSIPVDELRLRKITKGVKTKRGTWEVDSFYFPGAVEEGERPFFPCIGVIMEHGTGIALHFWLEPPWQFVSLFTENLLTFVEEADMLPEGVLVTKEELFDVLEPMTSRLGIDLDFVGILENVEEFKASMITHLSGFAEDFGV
jgi:hypothetical protein